MWNYMIWIPALLLLWLGRLIRAREPKRAGGRMAIVFGLVVVARLFGGLLITYADKAWIPEPIRGATAAHAALSRVFARVLEIRSPDLRVIGLDDLAQRRRVEIERIGLDARTGRSRLADASKGRPLHAVIRLDKLPHNQLLIVPV